MEIPVQVAASAVAVVTAVVGYMKFRHLFSGNVNSTPAADLWKRLSDLQDYMGKELDKRDRRIDDLSIKLNEKDEKISYLTGLLRVEEREKKELELEVSLLQEQVRDLRRQTSANTARIEQGASAGQPPPPAGASGEGG